MKLTSYLHSLKVDVRKGEAQPTKEISNESGSAPIADLGW